jgi:hypothetical protein
MKVCTKNSDVSRAVLLSLLIPMACHFYSLFVGSSKGVPAGLVACLLNNPPAQYPDLLFGSEYSMNLEALLASLTRQSTL